MIYDNLYVFLPFSFFIKLLIVVIQPWELSLSLNIDLVFKNWNSEKLLDFFLYLERGPFYT